MHCRFHRRRIAACLPCIEHLDISAPRFPERIAETTLRVLGSPHAVNEHLHFTDNPVLKIGDEVRVRIVETVEPTKPVSKVDVTPPNPPKSEQPFDDRTMNDPE
jgi:hypothetical protein